MEWRELWLEWRSSDGGRELWLEGGSPDGVEVAPDGVEVALVEWR